MCRNELRKFIPEKILTIILKNSKKDKPKSNFNIYNEMDYYLG